MEKLRKSLFNIRNSIEPIKKEKDNPFFKSKYADLPTILEVLKPLIQKESLVMTHIVSLIDGKYVLCTQVLHLEEKESAIESIFPLFGSKPQEFGSSITYARRYNIQAIFDLPTEDDDGNSANEAPRLQKFDLKEFIEDRIRNESDSNHLATLYQEAMKNSLTKKQQDWLTKECAERKELLNK